MELYSRFGGDRNTDLIASHITRVGFFFCFFGYQDAQANSHRMFCCFLFGAKIRIVNDLTLPLITSNHTIQLHCMPINWLHTHVELFIFLRLIHLPIVFIQCYCILLAECSWFQRKQCLCDEYLSETIPHTKIINRFFRHFSFNHTSQ